MFARYMLFSTLIEKMRSDSTTTKEECINRVKKCFGRKEYEVSKSSKDNDCLVVRYDLFDKYQDEVLNLRNQLVHYGYLLYITRTMKEYFYHIHILNRKEVLEKMREAHSTLSTEEKVANERSGFNELNLLALDIYHDAFTVHGDTIEFAKDSFGSLPPNLAECLLRIETIVNRMEGSMDIQIRDDLLVVKIIPILVELIGNAEEEVGTDEE